jgi:hypothetical protein
MLRHKKLGVGLALLVLLLGAVLGATVLREPMATAATPFQNVIVANTADNPVPVTQTGTANVNVTNTDENGNIKVHEQGTASVQAVDQTERAFTRAYNGNAEDTIDVSAFREIRVYANVDNCVAPGFQPATVVIKVLTGGGSPVVLDTFTVACVDQSRTYEIPGQRLLLEWHGTGGAVTMFGRAN